VAVAGEPVRTPQRSPITNQAEWQKDRPVALRDARRPKVESVFLYRPETEWTYSHHQSITFFNGRFYAIWSNGRQDEDAPGQRVLIAVGQDFKHWSTPRPLVDSVKDTQGVERVLTAAGFHDHLGMLVAYFGNYGPNKETTHLQALTTTDGEHWSPVREMGVPVNPNHGPQRTYSGRLIISGNISFPWTDDPAGLAGWRMTGIYPSSMAATIKDDPSSFWDVAQRQRWSAALCEGSFYQTDDGRLHMLLRNTAKNAFRLWVTESADNGARWSTPVETQFSDTNAKFHFGRLPDGRFYYVGNPIGGGRTPLVLSLSRDGVRFDDHFILGDDHYASRRKGRWKGGEYGYPHTMVHEGHLYVIVSRQKEAVEVLRVALSQLRPKAGQAPKDPNLIQSPAELKARIPKQLHITRPDYVVFVPEVTDAGVNDTGNEHFLVFDGPDRSLMAVWTQSSVENYSADMPADQHIAFARSTDGGVTWTKPQIIAGPRRAGDGHMASWGYPLVSRSGRIYVLYSQHIGRYDSFFHHTGWLHGVYSDDLGRTWSQPQNVPVARSANDNPDPTMPPNMLCWQKPLRLGQDGKYFAGFTRWTSFDVRKNPTKSWMSADARVEFMRFENVDQQPEPRELKIAWFAANDKALAVPYPGHPEVSACQEPTVVKLPDGRLFCVMRTASGSPFWSVSADVGETWSVPRRLLRKDGGEPLLHPLSPCPMYDVGGNEAGSGRYVLFIHNHDGHYKYYQPTDSGNHRRPIYLVAGRYEHGAFQPVWFDEPRLFMDHDGTTLGKPGTKGRTDLALYSSFTVRNGQPVLWYPERKFFLLGRIIGPEWLETKKD
jgi:hypothetical protein